VYWPRRVRRRLCPWLVLLGLQLVAPSPSMAQPSGTPQATPEPTVTTESAAPAPATERRSLLTAIEVEPGATCLAADKLIRRVERWLEQARVDARIRVHVRGDSDEPTRVAFSIDRGDGEQAERVIENAPTDCDQLHSALALSIALAIDATLLDGTADLPDDEALLGEEEEPEPAEPAYFRLAVGAFGQASSGLLTDVALGASARVEVSFLSFLDLRIGGMFATVSDQRLGEAEGRFDATLWAVRADVCGALALIPELRLLACAAGLGGPFRTVGYDLLDAEPQSEPWFAVGGGLEAQVSLSPSVALAVAADLILPLAKRSIVALDALTEEVVGTPRELTSAGALVSAGLVFRIF
jgi:hypothetical protein